MKFQVLLLIALPLISPSCKKSAGPENGNGCIKRIYIERNDHAINSADIKTVDRLFSDNKIDNRNFRYTKYRNDSLQRLYAPYEKVDRKHVRVNEYVKGLRVIDSDVIFNFTNNVFQYTSKKPVNAPGVDLIPRLSLYRLREMFLEDVKKERPFSQGNYADSCLEAEFGLYIIGGNENNAGKVVKAWLVTGKNRTYPRAVYNDNGNRIYYTTGIIPTIPN